MTVEEAASTYGLKEYRTSAGDSLTSIVRRIYNSDDRVYYQIILGLNKRYDWYSVLPNQIVKYLEMSAANKVEELW